MRGKETVISFFIGTAAGLFGGLVGLGGGVIMIPLMVHVLGLSQHQAHGTSLAALVFTGLTGAAVYGLKGTVAPLAAAVLAASAMPTARWGAFCAHSLAEWKLKAAFGGFIISVSLFLLLKPGSQGAGQPFPVVLQGVILLTGGALSGFIAGLMGVGGGSVMVPALVLLLGFSQHLAQGTSLLAMVPAGAVGAYTHFRLGKVTASLVPGLVAGITAGTAGGSFLAHMLSEPHLRLVFAGVLVWQGCRDIRRGLRLRKEPESRGVPK